MSAQEHPCGTEQETDRQSLMWLGGTLDALCQSLIYGSSPSPLQLRIPRRRHVGTRDVGNFCASSQVQYGWPPARGCCSACPPALQATYGPYQLDIMLPEGDYVKFMCFPPSFLRSPALAVTRIPESSYCRIDMSCVFQTNKDEGVFHRSKVAASARVAGPRRAGPRV